MDIHNDIDFDNDETTKMRWVWGRESSNRKEKEGKERKIDAK